MKNFNISSLLNPQLYNHAVTNIDLIETHISWVILTGNYAYKIKKPVNFGFLDFSTLQKRQRYCEQEIKLNRRLAPELYLQVVAIAVADNKLTIDGEGEIIEYAVKMLQFAQEAQLDHMLEDARLTVDHMEALAVMIANFHQSAAIAGETQIYGNYNNVNQPVEENFVQIKEHLDVAAYQKRLQLLAQWSQQKFIQLENRLKQRKTTGYIRECHGDMHLRNLVWWNNKPMAFDCIEFNEKLRWIDVMSEISFLVMDLQSRQQVQMAHRFLNKYLEITGDYTGLEVFNFYICYRAMVRAKVAVLRLEQENRQQQTNQLLTEFELYLDLAMTYTLVPVKKLIIMSGLSASGKSTISQQLTDILGMIRIRSDVERKRMFNTALDENAENDVGADIYSSSASEKTYGKLLQLSESVIKAGFSPVIDAAFLQHQQRKPFQQLASRLGVEYLIVEITAPADVLRLRIVNRKNDVSDADLNVLEQQLINVQPLQEDEKTHLISFDTHQTSDIKILVNEINKN